MIDDVLVHDPRPIEGEPQSQIPDQQDSRANVNPLCYLRLVEKVHKGVAVGDENSMNS